VAGAQIAVVEGPESGREFEVSGTITVGREGDIVIEDSEISRSHASLSWDGSALTVQDLGSTNGTFVNGERLAGPRQVGPGDKLRIGSSVFELRVPAGDQATRIGTLPGQDDIDATAARPAPDFGAGPPPSGSPGGVGGPPGGPPAGGPPPAGPPPGAPPPSAQPAGPPPPAYAPPPAYGSAPPPYPGGGPAPSYSPVQYVPPGGAELSGWWRRVGAALLDFVISLPFLIFIYVLVVSPILMARDGPNNGQTWGKQALGIRVVRDDGQPFTYGTALLRDFVVKNLLFGALAVVQLVNVLWPLWDESNQALHDKLLGTHVLRA
jgi:uncharacterized RDD family membrane protein YckC